MPANHLGTQRVSRKHNPVLSKGTFFFSLWFSLRYKFLVMYLFKLPYHWTYFRITNDFYYKTMAKYGDPRSLKEVEDKN